MPLLRRAAVPAGGFRLVSSGMKIAQTGGGENITVHRRPSQPCFSAQRVPVHAPAQQQRQAKAGFRTGMALLGRDAIMRHGRGQIGDACQAGFSQGPKQKTRRWQARLRRRG